MLKCVVALLCLVSQVYSASKLPPTLKTCKASNPKFQECLIVAVEGAIKDLKNGYPPLKMNPIDPMTITAVDIAQGNRGPVQIDLKFRDFRIEGFSKAKIINPVADLKNSRLFAQALIPKLIVTGDYEINGRILVLPIVGKGDCRLLFEDVAVNVTLPLKEFSKNGNVYEKVENFNFEFTPKKLVIRFNNLFNGDKALGDNMNRFLNDNWPEILAEVREAIQEAVGAAFSDIANRLFTKVPIKEIFPD